MIVIAKPLWLRGDNNLIFLTQRRRELKWKFLFIHLKKYKKFRREPLQFSLISCPRSMLYINIPITFVLKTNTCNGKSFSKKVY